MFLTSHVLIDADIATCPLGTGKAHPRLELAPSY